MNIIPTLNGYTVISSPFIQNVSDCFVFNAKKIIVVHATVYEKLKNGDYEYVKQLILSKFDIMSQTEDL